MARVTLFGFTILKSHTAREIHKLFEHYTMTMTAQKLKMFDDIIEWGDACMRSIYKYVTKQKKLLEQEYTNQIQHLNKTSQQFIDELRVYEQISNIEQIDELLDRCKALKFELTSLEHCGQTIPFIKVSSKEESVVINKDGFDVVEVENDKFDDNSTVKDNNETENSTNQQSLTIKTSNDGDRNNIFEECSTCFMVFPANMAPKDRITHANGHVKND